MSTSTRVIKNTGFLYGKMAITVFISLYSTRLILNALGASDYGVFNVVGGAIAMLGFLNASMAAATQRFMSYNEGKGDKDKQKKIFNTAVILHMLIAILVALLLLSLKPIFFNHLLNIEPSKIYAAKWIYYFTIFSTGFTMMTVPYDAVLNAHENMLYYSVVGIIQSLLVLFVAIIVVKVDSNKLIWYGGFTAFSCILVLLIERAYCKFKYEECKFKPSIYFDIISLKEMASFAGWNLLGSSSSVIWAYGTSLLINNFFGTVVNAASGVCGQINGQLQAFSSNMLKAVNPVIVKSEGMGDRERMFRASFSACKLSVMMYAFFAVPFVVDSSFILKLWLKNVPQYTLIFCQLTVIQVLVEEISSPLSTSINAVGKIKRYNIINSIILYIEVIIIFLLFKIDGEPALFKVVCIFGALVQLIFKIWYCKVYNDMSVLSFLQDVVFRSLVVIILTLLIAEGVKHIMLPSITRLSLIVFVSVIVFMVLFYFIALTKNEKDVVKNLIKIKIK